MDSALQKSEQGQTPGELDEILVADHRALEQTFRRLMARLEGGDPDTIRDGWAALERELEAHLEAEEKHILPHFGIQHPAEAAQLQREHAQIRATLLQLGVDLDLHSLREETAAQFISTLRRHAQSEELLFYRWARDHLPHAERHATIEALRAIRSLFRRPTPDSRDQNCR